MLKAKTHFEQVPIKKVKEIARIDPAARVEEQRGRDSSRSSEEVEIRSSSVVLGKFEARTRNSLPMFATCLICGKPVPLESCKIDENGKPVHEECAVSILVSGRAPLPATNPPTPTPAHPATRSKSRSGEVAPIRRSVG